MISIQRLNARGANKNGDQVVDYLMATEYYIGTDGQQKETMRWGGKLADELRLAGKDVSKADMLALAKGFSPSGEKLCQNAGEEPSLVAKLDRKTGKPKLNKLGEPLTTWEGGHRVGFDMTFSAPKPVSVAFALADAAEKERILEAHRKAVAVSMSYLEDKVETRRGHGGKDMIETEGLIYSQHDHMSNRNLDPNLHTHSLVFGVAKGVDGKWGTYDSKELYRHRRAADQIYKNELALEMRQLGYGIERYCETDADSKQTGRTFWKITGMSDELCEHFSSRRQELLAYQEKHGVDAQTACLATRRHKDEPSYAEMVNMWTQTMAQMDPSIIKSTSELKLHQDIDVAVPSNDLILERLHAREAYFSEHNLIEQLGMENTGLMGLADLQNVISAFKEERGLVHINAERIAEEDKGAKLSRVNTEHRFAAPWMVQFEQEVVHRAQSRQNETHQSVSSATVERTIAEYEANKGFTVSDEQRRAVRHLTEQPHGVSVLSGVAGSGKTTCSDLYSTCFRAEGRRMHGVAVSNAAALKLQQESGMPSMSVTKTLAMLDKRKLILSAKDVIVLDEAGMVDTRQTRALMTHCQDAGAKLIMQGDSRQLAPIGAGSGFSLARHAIGETTLTEIRRQANPEDRAIAGLFYDRDDQGALVEGKNDPKSRREITAKGTEILRALDARGCIDEYDNRPEAIEALVSDYLASSTTPDEKLALGHTRMEVALLNKGIRDGLQAHGKLSSEQVSIRAKDNGQWHDMGVSVGERVRFTARDNELGVINGTQGEVSAVAKGNDGGWDLTVRVRSHGQDVREVQFNTDQFNALQHNYAMTIHKAQGQGKTEVLHLANTGMMDNSSALVAFTRLTKGNYTLYGSAEDIEQVHERLGMDRLKGNATEAGVRSMPPATGFEAEVNKMLTAMEHPEPETKQTVAPVQNVSKLSAEDDKWIDLHTARLAHLAHGRERLRDRGHSYGSDRGQTL